MIRVEVNGPYHVMISGYSEESVGEIQNKIDQLKGRMIWKREGSLGENVTDRIGKRLPFPQCPVIVLELPSEEAVAEMKQMENPFFSKSLSQASSSSSGLSELSAASSESDVEVIWTEFVRCLETKGNCFLLWRLYPRLELFASKMESESLFTCSRQYRKMEEVPNIRKVTRLFGLFLDALKLQKGVASFLSPQEIDRVKEIINRSYEKRLFGFDYLTPVLNSLDRIKSIGF